MVDGGGNATRRSLCCLCHSVRLVAAASVVSSVTSDCVHVAAANVGACCIDAISRSSLHTRSKMLELSSSPGVNFGGFRMSCATKRTGHPLPNLASMSPIARIISSHSVRYAFLVGPSRRLSICGNWLDMFCHIKTLLWHHGWRQQCITA